MQKTTQKNGAEYGPKRRLPSDPRPKAARRTAQGAFRLTIPLLPRPERAREMQGKCKGSAREAQGKHTFKAAKAYESLRAAARPCLARCTGPQRPRNNGKTSYRILRYVFPAPVAPFGLRGSKGRAREEQGKSCARAAQQRAQELRKSSRASKKQHGTHACVWGGPPLDSVVQDNVKKRKMRFALRFPYG